MGFENVRDSCGDLLQIKAANQSNKKAAAVSSVRKNKINPVFGGAIGIKQSIQDVLLKLMDNPDLDSDTECNESKIERDDLHQQESVPNLYQGYDSELDDEDNWPIWEMTREQPWQDGAARVAGADGAENIDTDGVNDENEFVPSIAQCERIFTVPEVCNDLMEIQPFGHYYNSIVYRHHDTHPGLFSCWNTRPQEPTQQNCNEIYNKGGIFHCLFPWNQKQTQHYNHQKEQEAEQVSNHDNNSQKFCHSKGERPSSHIIDPLDGDQEHRGPIAPVSSSFSRDKNKRGVLCRSSMAVQMYLGMPASVRRSFTPSMFKAKNDPDENSGSERHETSQNFSERSTTRDISRRHDVNASENARTPRYKKSNFQVHFSELKRVLKVRKFTSEEALQVWFQRQDFDHFKAEMTLLIQEEEASCELAEIWLDAKEVVSKRRHNSIESEEQLLKGKQSATKSGNTDEKTPLFSSPTASTSSSSRSLPTQHISTKARAWWHDYDHSRRGLERYASPNQARQILASYKIAVKQVLKEQRRQRTFGYLFCCFACSGGENAASCSRRGCGVNDPDKIAQVYHEYTAWSRDLALAAGASDADAVRTNFDNDKRKTREYYILKQVIASGYKVHKHMPQFMLPKCITPKGYLDESESLYFDDREEGGPYGNVKQQHLRESFGVDPDIFAEKRRIDSSSDKGRGGNVDNFSEIRESASSSTLSITNKNLTASSASRNNATGEFIDASAKFGGRYYTTEEANKAREEMSHPHIKDLEGPVSPALVPSLEVASSRSNGCRIVCGGGVGGGGNGAYGAVPNQYETNTELPTTKNGVAGQKGEIDEKNGTNIDYPTTTANVGPGTDNDGRVSFGREIARGSSEGRIQIMQSDKHGHGSRHHRVSSWSGGKGSGPKQDKKKSTMAEKAKNFPF